MGAIIPQVVTASRATGVQVIDGSLKFNPDKSQHLKRTPGSAGNRKIFTWSAWLKRSSNLGAYNGLFFAGSGNTDLTGIDFKNTDEIRFTDTSLNDVVTSQLFRDVGAGWYNIVYAVDVTQGTNANKVKVYVNGTQVTDFSASNYPSNADQNINNTDEHLIGKRTAASEYFDGMMSQVYLIDGQQLDASYFGFTDGLTNTWKPKKYEGTFGTNGFYLPMDGNSPVGQDQSGNGNDWTPVNFGGSVELDSPQVSGARPILNTTQGGTQAGVGVFGSKQNVGYAVTVYDDGGGNKYYIDGVKQDTVTGLIRGATYTFDTSDSTVSSHPFRFSATSNGSHGGGSEYTNGVAAITGAATTITVPYNAPNTLYYYCTSHSGMGADITGITTNEKLADQYASNCTLAIPFAGNKEDVSASIACTSTTGDVSNTNAVSSNASSNYYSRSWYFDASGDYLTVPYSADSFNFGTGDFTVEAYVNQLARANFTAIISSTNTSINVTNHWTLGYSNTSDMLSFKLGSGGSSAVTANFSAHYGKWSHVAATRESGTIRLFFDGQEVASATDTSSLTGDTSNAVKIGQRYTNQNAYSFNGYMSDLRVYKGVAKYTSNFVPAAASPDVLPDTPSGVSGGSKLTKITDGGVSFNGSDQYLSIADNADFTVGSDPFTIEFYAYKTESGEDFFCGSANSGGADASMSYGVQTGGGSPSNSLRAHVGDGSSLTSVNSGVDFPTNRWVHVAFVRDGNTLRLFQDGIQMSTTSFSGTVKDSADPFMIGRGFGSNSTKNFPGIISNFRFIKGTALYTKNFTPPSAPLTNVTNTKLLCCQSPTSAIEAAVSPSTPTNGGTSLAINFNPFNTDISTVRGQESGYATLNPLAKANISLSDGNLALAHSGTNGNWQLVLSTIGMSSGKFYCEFLCQDADSVIGIAKGNHVIANDKYVGQDPGGYSYNGQNGQKLNNSSGSSYGSSYAAGDLIGIAFDGDNGTLRFYKNNDDQGQAFSGLTDEYFFAFSIRDTGYTHSVNFGQKPFKYAPPDGFQPLNAANARPVNVISRPDQYVGVTTYTGDGNSSGRHINIGFRPDLMWLKSRATGNHGLYDSVRGPDKRLQSDGTASEDTVVFPGASNLGFDFGSETYYNGSSVNYVAWTWKAGGNKNTFNVDDVGYASAAAAGLDGGTITPTGASVGTKQGFSIITYTGDGNTSSGVTISHGLGKTPAFIITKKRSSGTTDYGWSCWHKDLGGNYGIWLHLANARNISMWGGHTNISSTLFSPPDLNYANENTQTYVNYLWSEIPGFSKFGTYEGGGNAFVELGFRPALVLFKNMDGSENWNIFDGERSPFNSMTISLQPNLNGADYTSEPGMDFLSNGFKCRGSVNTSATYIYAAWAEAPSIDLFGGGANAR